MKVPPYIEILTDLFNEDFALIVDYIIESNIDANYDVEFAIEKSEEFEIEVRGLIKDLTLFPDQGLVHEKSGVRGKPIYSGRYSVRWVVNHNDREVTLISIIDNERPKELRYRNVRSDT